MSTFISILAVTLLAGCGGNDESSTTEATTTSETIDAVAFKDCILGDSLQRGIYEEVPDPSGELQQLADDAGAQFFEAGKADDGLVLFYVVDSSASTKLSDSLQGPIDQFAADLAQQAPKSFTLGEASIESAGPVVIGLLPFSSEKADELTTEALADVAACVGEA